MSDFVDSDLVISGFSIQNSIGGIMTYSYNFEGTPLLWMRLEIANMMRGSLWNKFFRADIIRNHNLRFDIRFSFREDDDFVFRYLIYSQKIQAVEFPTYYYFEPDFGIKYEKMYENLRYYELLCKLQKSYIKLGLDRSITKDNIFALWNRLKYNIKHDPIRALQYVMNYIILYLKTP